MSTTTTLSDLLRSPTEVIERLDAGDVVLTRRGAESLRLSKESSASQEQEMVGALAQLLAAALDEDVVVGRVAGALQTSFPWLEFLDESTTKQFVADFLRTAHACASIGRFERLAVEVANWRETAVAYSLGLQRRPAELDYLSEGVAVEDPSAS